MAFIMSIPIIIFLRMVLSLYLNEAGLVIPFTGILEKKVILILIRYSANFVNRCLFQNDRSEIPSFSMKPMLSEDMCIPVRGGDPFRVSSERRQKVPLPSFLRISFAIFDVAPV